MPEAFPIVSVTPFQDRVVLLQVNDWTLMPSGVEGARISVGYALDQMATRKHPREPLSLDYNRASVTPDVQQALSHAAWRAGEIVVPVTEP